MSIGNLFGTGGESNSLYGTSFNSNVASSFIYFEWFIFKVSTGQPTTPTGGSWDFLTNTGTPPTGWTSTVNGVPLDNLWFSIAFVDSRNPTNIVWSTAGLLTATTSVYATAYADTFTGNGSTTNWTLTQDPVVVNNLDVSINGVTQTPVTDYTISGTTFTTTTAAPLGSIILVKYRQALPNSYFGTANNVGYTPFSWIAATNVQAALNEVATDISATDGVRGSNLVGYKSLGAGAVANTVQAKLREYVSILDFGADPTGVTLCNTALDAAKVVCNTVYFPPGTYRIENYNLQDLRLVGAGGDGPNYGSFTTIIEGSGDIFVDANNFSMSNLAIRNTASGTLGKLIQVKDIDTGIGPIISCQFLRAAYHIYHQSTLYTIVGATIQQCLFREATVYSRYYANQGLFQYSEFDCYTAANKRGLFIQSTSACLLAASVFEFNDEGAVYVQNTTVFSDVIRGLKFQSIHFEQNGNVTPSADVTVLVTLSKARVEFDNCGFYSSTVPGNVNLLGSTNVLIFDHNCTNISYNNGGGGKITQVNPTAVGELNAIKVIDRDIQALGGVFIGNRGFLAASGIYTQISSTATPTSIAVPTTNGTLLIVVRDATTEGGALLLLTTTTVTVVSSSLTNITFSIAAGFLNGRTTGGASSRDLYFNYMGT